MSHRITLAFIAKDQICMYLNAGLEEVIELSVFFTRNCFGAFLMNMNPCTVEMKVATAVNVSSNAQNSVPFRLWNILKGYVTVTEARQHQEIPSNICKKIIQVKAGIVIKNWTSKSRRYMGTSFLSLTWLAIIPRYKSRWLVMNIYRGEERPWKHPPLALLASSK